MRSSLRVVLDTNVLVSAAIKPHGVLPRALRQGAFQLLLSEPVVVELVDVLKRAHLRQKYALTPEYIHAYLQMLRQRGAWLLPSEAITICRDPDDDKFLELAVAGQADVLVSRDADLLSLHPFRQIFVVKPTAFLAMIVR